MLRLVHLEIVEIKCKSIKKVIEDLKNKTMWSNMYLTCASFQLRVRHSLKDKLTHAVSHTRHASLLA